MDFSSDYSIVWNTACQQDGIGNYEAGSCELNPTLLSSAFDQNNNSTGLIRESGIFSNLQIGGYVASGTKYTSEMCLTTPDAYCKLVQIYSGETVTADNWMFNKDGAYGILGVGPNSKLWSGFIDADTLMATYSIEIARIAAFSEESLG
jgi:hypothetical protein